VSRDSGRAQAFVNEHLGEPTQDRHLSEWRVGKRRAPLQQRDVVADDVRPERPLKMLEWLRC
jgi:hypothetical protein